MVLQSSSEMVVSVLSPVVFPARSPVPEQEMRTTLQVFSSVLCQGNSDLWIKTFLRLLMLFCPHYLEYRPSKQSWLNKDIFNSIFI